jgi:glycosyltransferase involved in cell wall biosynthesis
MPEVSLEGVRVLFVLPSIGLGGAERQAFYLAKHLRAREGADAQLLSVSSRAALSEECDRAGVPYGFFTMRHGARDRVGQAIDLLRFIGLLRRRRVQILLPYCMFPNVFSGLAWRVGGARVCIWNQRDEGRDRLGPRFERMAVNSMSHFIANSTHGADFVINDLHVPSQRVSVVQNGIVMPDSCPAARNWRRELGLPSDAFVATMVANLHSKKDHATLIAAWRHVVDDAAMTGRAAHLLLAGQFSDAHEAVVAQVRQLGLDSQVHLLGQVQNVGDLYRTTDLAVFSSYNEGIPNAVLEAMSHRLAVVATDYPGIREAVGPGGFEMLARPRDARDLAGKILLAAQHPDLRSRLGEDGRRRIAEQFSVDRMSSEMTAIIRSAWQRALSGAPVEPARQ